ncbi:Biopolymer transport protein [Rubellimicrobium thermophilum DSM 16684]|uniref:Biopolymer transport protein n=1 Tax=Rubellimicrobium thermophilum DSM 16684 TaxID=1123069 RepID=S9R263_9RHOB|nr:biopolymer transporter ExbD [Rubellimicrobium thermophilum]EPX87756.1 Biopolymer transport protein [Rubellimicrobium thermophilum DSM 16684]
MRLSRSPRRRAEPTIALINVVFLMLVFFLVAGRIARPIEDDLRLVQADLAAARVPDDALVLRADGSLLWQGRPADPESAIAVMPGEGPLRLLPDRDLPARDLIAVAARLRELAGDREVRLVTERGLTP